MAYYNTKARRRIIRFLKKQNKPVSVVEINKTISNVCYTTIYRILNSLVKENYVIDFFINDCYLGGG